MAIKPPANVRRPDPTRAASLPPPIARADLIRALGLLVPRGTAELAGVLDVLGMRLGVPIDAPEARRPQQPQQHRPPVAADETEIESGPRYEGDDGEDGEGDERDEPLRTTLRVNELRLAEPPRLDITPMPIESELDLPLAEVPRLFQPRWSRGVVTTALSTRSSDGPPRVDRIVEALSRARPLREMPRAMLPTLRLGAQVLIDAGPGMTPFARDQQNLVRELRRILRGDRVSIASFVGMPMPHVRTPGSGLTPYAPPPRGTPVLLLSDLGIAGAVVGPESVSDVSAWSAFAARVAPAGCPLIAFVPYPPRRWPARLTAAMRIVQWDRPTGVVDVSRGRTNETSPTGPGGGLS